MSVLTKKTTEITKRLTIAAYKTEGVNRTKIVRVYPFVFTGKERDEEMGYGYFGWDRG